MVRCYKSLLFDGKPKLSIVTWHYSEMTKSLVSLTAWSTLSSHSYSYQFLTNSGPGISSCICTHALECVDELARKPFPDKAHLLCSLQIRWQFDNIEQSKNRKCTTNKLTLHKTMLYFSKVLLSVQSCSMIGLISGTWSQMVGVDFSHISPFPQNWKYDINYQMKFACIEKTSLLSVRKCDTKYQIPWCIHQLSAAPLLNYIELANNISKLGKSLFKLCHLWRNTHVKWMFLLRREKLSKCRTGNVNCDGCKESRETETSRYSVWTCLLFKHIVWKISLGIQKSGRQKYYEKRQTNPIDHVWEIQ